MDKIKIGLVGLGTVGSGVFKELYNNDKVEISKIVVKNLNKKRDIKGLENVQISDNVDDIIFDKDIKIVIEVIGGLNPAFDIIKKSIENGKHVVTANKELLAKKGEEIFEIAEKNNKVILYEAAVAGGIPIINPLKTILSNNRLTKVAAILNGTTNYILTKMEQDSADYNEVLADAQKLGYAEVDPTSDVEGYDAAYKIAILSTLAFKKRVSIDKIYREGITNIKAEDIECASDFGYKIKLIALAQIFDESKIDVRVHPMLVKNNKSLAHINFVTNAIMMQGKPIGEIMCSGPGAGEFPTAASVVGDVMTIASEINNTDIILPMMRCTHSVPAEMVDVTETENRYYLSVNAKNKIGVIEALGRAFSQNNISVSNILQKGVQDNDSANIVIITELCKEKDMQKAVSLLKNDSCVNQINSLIRVME
ncbi:MAG: homoserine dehydrogenase [bacterium]|nr:homoserine dehydrogenase [bacterium]